MLNPVNKATIYWCELSSNDKTRNFPKGEVVSAMVVLSEKRRAEIIIACTKEEYRECGLADELLVHVEKQADKDNVTDIICRASADGYKFFTRHNYVKAEAKIFDTQFRTEQKYSEPKHLKR